MMLMRDNFFLDLVYFDKSQLSSVAASQLALYCSDPAFTPEEVSHISVAAAHVCQWVRALHCYAQKRQKRQPLLKQIEHFERERKQVRL